MIEWQNIRSVFLDLDGTLLDLYYDNHFWLEHVPMRYAEQHNMEHDEAKETLKHKYAKVFGSLNWYCVDYWSRELALDIPLLKREISSKICVRPQVKEFLQFITMMGKRVVLVTNAHPASVAIKMDTTGLDKYFDRIVTSHELHHAKEEAAFWPALQATEPFNKNSTLFIDDNFDVLDAAKDYGIENLLAIKKPDSRGEDKEHEHYALLESFDQIIE